MKKFLGFSIVLVFVLCVSLANQNAKERKSSIQFQDVEALTAEVEEGGTKLGCKLHLTSICETSNKDHYLYRNR